MRRDLSLMLRAVCSEKELLTAMNCTPLKKGYIRLKAIYTKRQKKIPINFD